MIVNPRNLVRLQTPIDELGATGGLPASADTLHSITIIEAIDSNRSIALADKLPVVHVNRKLTAH